MKKFFGTMAVAAALFAGYSAYEAQNRNELSDVALANVEALANNSENPCTYKNGFKKWNTSGLFGEIQFYDCCKVLRTGYSPSGNCD